MICRVCDHSELIPVLDLGIQPWGNHFLRPEEVGQEPRYPLRLVFCPACRTAQLDYTVPKEVMFTDHTYVSGTTATLRNHFAATARHIRDTYFPKPAGRAVLDIGSNDGTQLQEYRALGFDVLGVDSCAKVAGLAVEQGIPTEVAFFNEDRARQWKRSFQVINASGVFFHLEDLHSVTRGIQAGLAPDGVFVVQFLYMKNIVEINAFDQIYHEHLLYYNLRTIERLLQRHGLASFDASWSDVHGGSIILLVGHPGARPPTARLQSLLAEEDRAHANELETYQAFSQRARQHRDDINAYLAKQKGAGRTIYGLGAPVKGNTLLNYCGIGTGLLDYLVEKNPLRGGLYAPGSHIPIILESEVPRQPDIYFVLAWNFKREIVARYQHLVDQGVELYFPIQPREKP